MPEFLQLYPPEQLRTAVETVDAVDPQPYEGRSEHEGPNCSRCSLSNALVDGGRLLNPCVQPDTRRYDRALSSGEGLAQGTLLIIGDVPCDWADRRGIPFVGQGGRMLRDLIDKHWNGPVVYDTAVRCRPSVKQWKKRGDTTFQKAIHACRGFLKHAVETYKPAKILCLGSVSAKALLGRAVDPFSTRRGFTHLSDGTPVLFGMDPDEVLRNTFLSRWFKGDLIWALETTPPYPEHWQQECLIVRTRKDALKACEMLRSNGWFAFDTETAGRPYDDKFWLLCLAACAQGSEFPWVWTQEALENPETAEPLWELMRDESVGKVGHNLKYDLLAVHAAYDVRVKGVAIDTMNDRRLLFAGADADLDAVGERLGYGGHKREAKLALAEAVTSISKARKKYSGGKKTGGELLYLPGMVDPILEEAARRPEIEPLAYAYGLIPAELLWRYCALDTMVCARIAEWQGPRMEQRKVHTIARKIVLPAMEAYAQIESWGMVGHRDRMLAFTEHATYEKTKIAERLRNRYGEFNPSSDDQVRSLLFGKLGIKPRERDKTGTGLDGVGAAVLKKIDHPFAKELLEYRRYDKLVGTYGAGLLKHLRADGRVHPTFMVTGTETGRPACKDPNMQNYPRPSTLEGKMVRNCFGVPEGHCLIELDYSQIEIRVGAMLSGDREMIDCYKRGEDLHWKTTRIIAPQAWNITAIGSGGKDTGELTKDHRTQSKVVTFGLMYGKTDSGLADDLNCSLEHAGVVRQAVLGAYPDFNLWSQEQIAEARRTGQIWTWWDGAPGRVRPLWQIGDHHYKGRATQRATTATNSAINTPIQGTASEFCVASVIEIVDACRRGHIPAKVVITIHDAILLECRDEDRDEVIVKCSAIMTKWKTLNGMPLVADSKVGPALGSIEDYEVAA